MDRWMLFLFFSLLLTLLRFKKGQMKRSMSNMVRLRQADFEERSEEKEVTSAHSGKSVLEKTWHHPQPKEVVSPGLLEAHRLSSFLHIICPHLLFVEVKTKENTFTFSDTLILYWPLVSTFWPLNHGPAQIPQTFNIILYALLLKLLSLAHSCCCSWSASVPNQIW